MHSLDGGTIHFASCEVYWQAFGPMALVARLSRRGLAGSALSCHVQVKDHSRALQHVWNHDHETSMRPLVHTTGQLLWTDVGLSTTRQEGPWSLQSGRPLENNKLVLTTQGDLRMQLESDSWPLAPASAPQRLASRCHRPSGFPTQLRTFEKS